MRSLIREVIFSERYNRDVHLHDLENYKSRNLLILESFIPRNVCIVQLIKPVLIIGDVD